MACLHTLKVFLLCSVEDWPFLYRIGILPSNPTMYLWSFLTIINNELWQWLELELMSHLQHEKEVVMILSELQLWYLVHLYIHVHTHTFTSYFFNILNTYLHSNICAENFSWKNSSMKIMMIFQKVFQPIVCRFFRKGLITCTQSQLCLYVKPSLLKTHSKVRAVRLQVLGDNLKITLS